MDLPSNVPYATQHKPVQLEFASLSKLFRDRPRHGSLFSAGMERPHAFHQSDQRLHCCRGVVPDASGDHEELTRRNDDRSAVNIRPADAQLPAQHQKHLVLVLMGVPGELPLDLCHFDVLVVYLTKNSGRPELGKSGARKF